MKLLTIVLVTLAILSSPILTFACPPPPAPGYDGGEVGSGALPGDDHSNGNVQDGGGNDSGSAGDVPSDVTVADECM
ncbi:MAG: hypothetical protein K8T20_12605 [Planctomycetes bacterium]|nr:hypothetical protein [Planctomycetota bacterium]